jgi:hypothetical protein
MEKKTAQTTFAGSSLSQDSAMQFAASQSQATMSYRHCMNQMSASVTLETL